MKQVAYFCTGGYTETGGLVEFLRKINPHVEWIRCFPNTNKPPKIKRGEGLLSPLSTDNGVSGDKLVRKMLERLTLLKQQSIIYDHILFIDDADCRFNEGSTEDYPAFCERLKREVTAILEREDIQLFVLFASPEIEAWLLADWEHSFHSEYPRVIADGLAHHLNANILPEGVPLENYGGAFVNGACQQKLSTQIQSAFAHEQLHELFIHHPGTHYSKSTHGATMLRRLDPVRVADQCTRYFAPVYRQLCIL